MRVGIGYDVHAFAPGRRLVLGGVDIPFEMGLDGWSDADVLTHAIMDALLGAASLGDIGSRFPPGEPEYRDISSLELLERVQGKLAEHSWQVGNIDATVVAERPKLKDYIDEMRERLGRALGIEVGCISIKASTSEGLGFTGRGEGIAAVAIALLVEARLPESRRDGGQAESVTWEERE
jgi:2-C-methyl-D-erythritol 2,4-cyclodiphosphate synthase